MKKKKSKKKPFDLEAALADSSDAAVGVDHAEKSDTQKDSAAGGLDTLDFDDNLDLENFGKKKKKKKKPFNLEEIENSLPTGDAEADADADALGGEGGAGEDGEGLGEEFDLDVDFSKTKKKKKKKKDLDELVAEKLEEDVQANKENGECEAGCERRIVASCRIFS